MNLSQFQREVSEWCVKCFGLEVANDTRERNHRFLEEAIELVQALGCTQDEAAALVQYVYSRPAGSGPQEVGGVMVTLAALCQPNAIALEYAARDELERVEQPHVMKKIRAKQAAKPKLSPLPGPS